MSDDLDSVDSFAIQIPSQIMDSVPLVADPVSNLSGLIHDISNDWQMSDGLMNPVMHVVFHNASHVANHSSAYLNRSKQNDKQR